jgi:DNA topoisomerase-2
MPPKVTSKSTANGGSGNAAGSEDLQKYQKMTDLEHILKKPDTYIGTNEPTETMEYVMDAAVSSPSVSSTAIESDDATASVVPGAAAPSLTRRNITYIPGLYKLFDEGMVNMRDHVVRQADRKSVV